MAQFLAQFDSTFLKDLSKIKRIVNDDDKVNQVREFFKLGCKSGVSKELTERIKYFLTGKEKA